MTRTLAFLVLVGLSLPIAAADDKTAPLPSKLSTPAEDDWRLAKKTGTQPQKIGVLSYYRNQGGGYTFLEHEQIVFYGLPYLATPRQFETTVLVIELVNGKVTRRHIPERRIVFTIGTSKMPLGGLTIYRGEMLTFFGNVVVRQDMPLATWTRDMPNGQFRLSIERGDHETRLKLKSAIPVLEHAP
jgi:hypothetical protein